MSVVDKEVVGKNLPEAQKTELVEKFLYGTEMPRIAIRRLLRHVLDEGAPESESFLYSAYGQTILTELSNSFIQFVEDQQRV